MNIVTKINLFVPNFGDRTLERIEPLLEISKEFDKVSAFSEQTLLKVQNPQTGNKIPLVVLAYNKKLPQPVGALIIDSNDVENKNCILEMVVHPKFRKQNIATTMINQVVANKVLTKNQIGSLKAFSPNNHAGANRIAKNYSFVVTRRIWKMQLNKEFYINQFVQQPITQGTVNNLAGIKIRNFTVSSPKKIGDETSWLKLNATVFMNHLEQGKITLTDLQARMQQPWFTAAGFFVANHQNSKDLVGFVWTKVEMVSEQKVGEIYVVGVAPTMQKKGLAKKLTQIALKYLLEQNVTKIVLYVDETNVGAIFLYKKLGFTQIAATVMYEQKF